VIVLPHLESNITIACENRCVACNHFVAVQVDRFKSSMIDPADLAVDLHHFGRMAHVDAWAAIGGEPTLHPRLIEILRVARSSGVADRIEVWTHGGNLREMSDAFWDALDVLVVSVYPGKLTDDDLIWIQAACEWHGVELQIKDERHHPNFSRLLEPEPSDAAKTARKYRECWLRTFSRVLDGGFFYRCCTSPFVPKLLLGLPEGTDGLRVDEYLTEDALQRFLDQPEAPASCALCTGRNTESSDPIPWREVRDPTEWLRASAGSA
jgi:GTP 3',8-cyclase